MHAQLLAQAFEQFNGRFEGKRGIRPLYDFTKDAAILRNDMNVGLPAPSLLRLLPGKR